MGSVPDRGRIIEALHEAWPGGSSACGISSQCIRGRDCTFVFYLLADGLPGPEVRPGEMPEFVRTAYGAASGASRHPVTLLVRDDTAEPGTYWGMDWTRSEPWGPEIAPEPRRRIVEG